MKKIYLFIFSAFLILSLNAVNHTIITVGNTFSPDTLTINVGDTVTWENNDLGFHNANGSLSVFPNNPVGFTSGSATTGLWTFEHIFNLAGTYNYQCDPHASMGMNGIIIVNSISVPGCTDSLACNYDSLATIDDSSCTYPTTSINTIVACDSYTWDGVTYTTSGAYTNTYTNAAGCDSTATLNLTINIGGCTDSLAYNYDPLASCNNGSCLPFPQHLFFSEAAEGSSNKKYFEVYNPTSDTVDLANYAFARVNGSPTTPGVYEYWNNFDSGAVILPNDVYIVVHPSADSLIIAEADMDFGSLSNGDDGFALVYGLEPTLPTTPVNGGYIILDWIGDWNGDPGQGWDVAGTGAATRNHTLIRKCPINQGDTSWLNAAGTDPVSSQWIVRPQNDWTNIGFHNTCICDSTTNSYTSITDTLCNGLSITVGNNTYDSTGVYSDTLLAYNGCDSIITTNLTVLNSSVSSTVNTITICDGDSVTIGSSIYTMTGSYTDILTNVAGCDSIITTHVNVQTPVFQNFTICDGDSITVGNSVYYLSGNYTDTIISSIGCDSIVHTNVTVYSQLLISGGIPDNTVGGGAYFSNSTQHLELSCYIGSELVSAVVYSQDTSINTFEIRDDAGNVLDSVTVTIIPGGHRIYFNYQMTAGMDYELGISGLPDGLFRNNSGVNYPYNFASAAAITSSSAGGNYYYFFYDIEVRASGSAALTTNYTICDGDSITVAGNTYTISGLYTDSLTSSIGCDSLVFSNLIVYPNVSYTNMQTICSGEITIVGNSVYDSTGVYTDTLTSWAGCDSIVTTNLTVLTIAGATTTNNQTVCLGDSISVGQNIYYYSGIYYDTLQDINGCDSIIITTLTTNGGGFLYGGKTDTTNTAPMTGMYSSYNGRLNLDNISPCILKSAAVYAQDTNSVTFELRNSNGIVLEDMTHTVYPGFQRINFNFLIPVDSNLQLGISAGGSGLYRNNAGTGNSMDYPYNIGPVTINSANTGSTQYYYFYYDLEIISSYIDTTICNGDSIQIGSNTYHTAGGYIDTMTTSLLCDSIVYVMLDLYQSPSLTISSLPSPPEICLGDSIVLEGSSGFTYYWWDNGVFSDRLVDYPTVDTWYLLTAKDSNDCVVKEDIWVYVDSCVSGIDYQVINEISIYPNPTNGLINIITDLDIEKISLYSVDGKLIEKTNNSSSLFIETKGIYFIKVKTSKGNIIRRIIVN